MDTVLDPRDLTITNATAVLPGELLADATVVIRDGLIAAVHDGPPEPGETAVVVDAAGAFVMPGLVDTHSDGLEKELQPRPGVQLPTEFGLRSFEGRVRAAGVTTMFHGVAYEDTPSGTRSVAGARRAVAAIRARAAESGALIDHRILYRLDVRSPHGFDALVDDLDGLFGGGDGEAPLVSYEDHTPGRGQYTQRVWYERYIAGIRGLDEAAAKRVIDELIAERDAKLDNVDRVMPWLAGHALAGRIRLMAHDPALDSEVADAVSVGAAIAEFPTTVPAAAAARKAGLRTVCGGPNALRGESHSGNVSARELIGLGLCDGLSSDYMPSTLLGSVATLVALGECDLPTAAALVTSGPADTVGLGDRGRLAPGLRGDLAVFTLDGPLPTVRLTVSQGSNP